jgi:hypothetical protein
MLCIGILDVFECFLTLCGQCVVCMNDLVGRVPTSIFIL